jgi:hypothetical protein
VRKCLPYPLKSLDLFAAAEFPHTPCAHPRALEGGARRLPAMPRAMA